MVGHSSSGFEGSTAVHPEKLGCCDGDCVSFKSWLLITRYTNQSIALTAGHLNPPVSGTGGGIGGVDSVGFVGKGEVTELGGLVSVGGFVGILELGGLVSGLSGVYGLPVGAVAVVGSNGMSNTVVSEKSSYHPVTIAPCAITHPFDFTI